MPNAYTGAGRVASPTRPLRPSRLLRFAAPALFAVVAACSSEGRFAVCGITSAVAVEVRPRAHAVITRDPAWPTRIAEEVEASGADSVVRVLLVHETAVTTADREFVTARAGTIVADEPEWNGFVATFTVAALRTFAPQASTTRIIDAHLVSERVLPPCE